LPIFESPLNHCIVIPPLSYANCCQAIVTHAHAARQPIPHMKGLQMNASIVQARPGVQNRGAAPGTMASMTGYASGAPTRRAILLALLEREPRTVNGLARDIGRGAPNVFRHLQRMETGGLVKMDRGAGRHGSKVYLTEAGRIAARTL